MHVVTRGLLIRVEALERVKMHSSKLTDFEGAQGFSGVVRSLANGLSHLEVRGKSQESKTCHHDNEQAQIQA